MPASEKEVNKWIDWGKTGVYVLVNLLVAAFVGGWRAHSSVSELGEQIHQNTSNISYHDARFGQMKDEIEKEFDLRDRTQEAHWSDLNQRLDQFQKQLDLTHSDVRDLRRRADQVFDKKSN